MAEITLIDKIAKIFFVYMPVELILKENIDDREFPYHRLVELMRCYNREYSDTESEMIGLFHLQRTKDHNVFQTLTRIANDLLAVRNNQICCRYENLLRWREISRELGEDLLVCAFMADDFLKNSRCWNNFTWNIVLGHNNKQLNEIMKEGISDNHFHLFGSAPVFPMIWIRMMNDIHQGKYMAGLMDIDKNRRHFQYDLTGLKERFSVNTLILQAALMRAVMFDALQQEELSGEYQRSLCTYWRLLKCGDEIAHCKVEIDELVRGLRYKTMDAYGTPSADYALEGRREPKEYSNWLFSGERKLIYSMLCDIFINKRLPESVQRMLYPYLVIRTWFRKEMVQTNSNIGFENFSVYNKRKNYFLPVSPTARQKQIFWQARERKQNLQWMVQHAVLESFQLKNLRSLEIRISPSEDFAANVKQIESYDRLLQKRKISETEKIIRPGNGVEGFLSLSQFFYVYHFSKRRDEKIKTDVILKCRHDRLRNRIAKQASAILKMRHLRPEIACRVRGIDACAMEIGCRPEVFSCVFRRLRMDVPSALDEDTERFVIAEYMGQQDAKDYFSRQQMGIPQLSVTYHAGEDFLDPVDGLRTLDEAIRFLDMESGDRFGHATVLGLNLAKWYGRKDYCIHLKAQDYLDNVMWFYMMILEFQMEDCELLKEYLLKEFLDTFHRIYGESEPASAHSKASYINIYNYYEAWKLRGDSPELYRTGRYRPPDSIKDGIGLISPNLPDDPKLREDMVISNLYYQYHFSTEVRKQGENVIEKHIPQIYVQGVLRIQKHMQEKIAQKGIGIEVNPSSNLAISTMDSYGEHPVLNIYTQGLEKRGDVPQMFVSINTDDRGVFHTSLETEYALLASSVENLRDESGKKIYTPQEVYEWINHIRVMGNQQVF